jgi:hypothetical protein
MEEEKRDGQKTVVAFISGLLIGGLLMWVFGAQPKKGGPDMVKKDDAQNVQQGTDANATQPTTDATAPAVAATTPEAPKVEVAQGGAGSIAVADQKAGMKVTLGDVKFPANGGWIAVQNIAGDKLGTTIGAARFDVKAGLVPKVIDLIGSTVAGNTYAVVFHGTDGDHMYTSATDKVVMGADGKPLATTFKAQ